jgi:hypothetical protein
MATDITGYIDVADVNFVIFMDSKKDDFITYMDSFLIIMNRPTKN